MKFFHYDKTLSIMKTPQGTMTLSRIFVPFFTEMLLLNMMGTINTLMLSHYSDDAVAAVGNDTHILYCDQHRRFHCDQSQSGSGKYGKSF